MVEWTKKKKKMAINFDFIDIDTVKKIIYLFEDIFFVYTQNSASMILYMRKNENGRRLIGFWFPAFSFQWTWR